MPRAPSVCTTKGCTAPAPHGQSKCDTHRLEQRRAHDQRRPSARQRGYDSRWERTRAEHLRLEPNCRMCGKPASPVDHIDGLGPNGPRGHDHDNLQSLCTPCHSVKTNRSDGGGWGTTAGTS